MLSCEIGPSFCIRMRVRLVPRLNVEAMYRPQTSPLIPGDETQPARLTLVLVFLAQLCCDRPCLQGRRERTFPANMSETTRMNQKGLGQVLYRVFCCLIECACMHAVTVVRVN